MWPGIKLIEGAARGRGRPRVRRQPRPAPADAHGARRRPRPVRRAPAARRQPRARPRRDGPERRPDPGDGDREVPAPRGARVGGPARGARRLRRDRRATWRRGDVRALGGGDHAELRRADPGHHPGRDQRLHRGADRRDAARSSARTSGASGCSAGMSGGGHGVHRRPGAEARGAAVPARGQWRGCGARCGPACRSRWSRSSTTSPSTRTAPRPTCCPPARHSCRAGTTRCSVPRWLREDPRAVPASKRERAGPRRAGRAPQPGPGGAGRVAVRPDAAERAGRRGAPGRRGRRCSPPTGSTASSTSASAPTCSAAGSGWRRTGCPRRR